MAKVKDNYRNTAEDRFYKLVKKAGWQATKRGFPDFVCYKGSKIVFVEVKTTARQTLKQSQRRLMQALAKRGIKCFRWSPDSGFEQVLGSAVKPKNSTGHN